MNQWYGIYWQSECIVMTRWETLAKRFLQNHPGIAGEIKLIENPFLWEGKYKQEHDAYQEISKHLTEMEKGAST